MQSSSHFQFILTRAIYGGKVKNRGKFGLFLLLLLSDVCGTFLWGEREGGQIID